MRCLTTGYHKTIATRRRSNLPEAVRHGGRLRSASLLPQRAITAVLLITAVMLLLTACDDPVGALLGLDRPQNVKATSGDYSDRIVVTWDGVQDKDDGEVTVEHYRITRSPNWTILGPRNIADTTYNDTENITPGIVYTYTVEAVYSDGGSSLPTSTTGYALDATELQIYSESNRKKGERSYDATSSDRWYNFAGQKGWTYRVEVSGAATTVELFRKGNIEDPLDPDLNEGPTTRIYRLPRSSHYHVKLTGGAGTISVSHR